MALKVKVLTLAASCLKPIFRIAFMRKFGEILSFAAIGAEFTIRHKRGPISFFVS